MEGITYFRAVHKFNCLFGKLDADRWVIGLSWNFVINKSFDQEGLADANIPDQNDFLLLTHEIRKFTFV
jgi:hypothetical protein